MRTVKFAVILLFIFLTSSSLPVYSADSQLILKAKIVSVKAFDVAEVVDALDLTSAAGALPSATAVFRIESIVKGTLPPKKVSASSSLASQMSDSLKEKSFLKILTMDYKNPDVEREDQPLWFAVGVQSPSESFKVVSWSELPKKSYKLSFSKDPTTQSWILQSATAA